jgi:WD40 repeat protein
MAGSDPRPGDDMADGPPADQTMQLAVAAGKMKVFISYSRRDVAFAGDLELALEDKGHEPLVDRHDIDPGEKWKDRLGQLIFACDTVVFVLSEHSAGSPTCAWEVEEAARRGKRMLVVAPGPVPNGVAPPPQLSDVNWIHCWRNPDIPNSSLIRGVVDLDRALKTDLKWLRQQTRLSEQAEFWRIRTADYDYEVNTSSALLRGNLLEEALAWMNAAPPGARVPSEIAAFLEASTRAEAFLKAQATSQIAEREAALQTAQKATRRARVMAITTIAIGVVLSIVALAGGWFALMNYARSNERQADLLVRESETLYAQGDFAAGALAALHANPAADAGVLGPVLWPEGYAPVREALARNVSASRFLSINTELSMSAVEDIRPIANGEWAVHVGGGSIARFDARLSRLLDTSPLLVGFGEATSVTMSPDASLMAIVLFEEIRVVRVSDQAVVARIAKGKPDIDFADVGLRVMFTPDLSGLLVFSPGKLFTLSLADGSVVSALDSPYGQPLEVDLSPNGKLVAVRTFNTVAVLSVLSGFTNMQRELNVSGMAWSPDGEILALTVIAGPNEAELQFLTRDDQRTTYRVPIHHKSEWGCATPAFSADGAMVVIACEGELIGYQTPWSRQEDILRVDGRLQSPTLGVDYDIEDLYRDQPRFSDDGNRLLLISPDNRIEIYETSDGTPLSAGYDIRAAEAQLSSDGATFAAFVNDGYSLFATRDGRKLATFERSDTGPARVSFLPDRNSFIAPLQGGGIGIWPASGGPPLLTYPAEAGANAWMPSANGRRIIAWNLQGAEAVKVWEAGKPAPVAELKLTPGDFTQAVLSRDGRRVVSASEAAVKLWDVDARKVVADLSRVDVDFGNVALSPDGRLALLGWEDGLNKLVLFETGEELTRFEPDGGFRGGVRFSADGGMFVTHGETLKLWNSASRRPVAELSSALPRGVVRFAPDETGILAWSHNSRLARIPIPGIVFDTQEAQVRAACGLLATTGNRDFSDEQWQRIGILDRAAPHPCREIWGFDPRKGETAAAP